jgi:hypothetical protein
MLCGEAWRRSRGTCRRRRARGGRSVDRMVSRATRRDLRASCGELVRRAMPRGRYGRLESRAALGDLAGAEEAAGRRAFIAAVARHG